MCTSEAADVAELVNSLRYLQKGFLSTHDYPVALTRIVKQSSA